MGSTPEEEQYRAHVGRIARGAGVSSFGQGMTRVFGYATQIALARMYGPALFGLYVLGTTVVSIANILSQVGLDNGVVRYVAHYRAEKDPARVRGTILLALGASFALSMIFAVLLFSGSGLLADRLFNKPSLAPLLRVFAVALPFLTVMSMSLWAIQGFQIMKYQSYERQVTQTAVNLVLIVMFYLLGAQIIGAVAAYTLSMAAGSVLAVYYLRRVYPRLLDRRAPAKYEPRAMAAVSGPMIVANVTQDMTSWTTVTVLGIFATGNAVGIYYAAFRVASLSTMVLLAFSGIFSPMVASFFRQGAMDHLDYLYKDVSRWTFTGSLALFLPTLVLARDIMAVFGSEFVVGWTAMALIAAAYLFGSSVGHTSRMLAMTGNQKMVMVATVGSTLVGVALCFALIPPFGLWGAATATAAATISSNAITLFAVRRLLGLWPYSRWYLKPVVAGACAAAAIYLGKLLLPVPSGIPALLVFTPVFLALFAALLFAFGLSPSDRQFVRSLWMKFRGMARRQPRTAPE